MNYNEGVQHMLDLKNEKGSFNPIPEITIFYPGFKKPGDYRLEFNNGKVPKYADICLQLYNLATENYFSFKEMIDFLNDIYNNGTNTTYKNHELENLKHLVYWITLQEEINYPRNKGYAGINLAFCRFFEAVYASKDTNTITIDDVIDRCNNHGKKKPNLYPIKDKPNFYHY